MDVHDQHRIRLGVLGRRARAYVQESQDMFGGIFRCQTCRLGFLEVPEISDKEVYEREDKIARLIVE